MAEITSSSLGELLKRLYASWEIEQLVNLSYPVLNRCFAKGNAQLGGVGFYFPVRVESAEGHAYITEAGNLPSPQQSVVRQAVVVPTVHAGVVQLTGLSMAVSQSDAAAFAEAFDENTQQVIEAMTAYKEGVGFRTGDGLLATLTPDPDDDVGPHTVDDVAFLREGMYVDVFDSGVTTAHHTAIKITAIDWVNRTVTFGTALSGVGNNAQIYITGAQTAGSASNKEPIGLEGSMLATGEYLGIDRATYGNWQANAYPSAGTFDENILLKARTRLVQEAGIQIASMASSFGLLCHPVQADAFFKLAIPRLQLSTLSSVDLGNTMYPKFGGIEFITSYLCPTNKAYLGDWRYSQSFYTPGGELHVDTQYNGSALKWVATRDVGLVFLKEYCAFALKRPNSFVRITGLTDPSR
jgi:hypothetical protein